MEGGYQIVGTQGMQVGDLAGDGSTNDGGSHYETCQSFGTSVSNEENDRRL